MPATQRPARPSPALLGSAPSTHPGLAPFAMPMAKRSPALPSRDVDTPVPTPLPAPAALLPSPATALTYPLPVPALAAPSRAGFTEAPSHFHPAPVTATRRLPLRNIAIPGVSIHTAPLPETGPALPGFTHDIPPAIAAALGPAHRRATFGTSRKAAPDNPAIALPRQLDLPLPVDPLRDAPDPLLLRRLGPAYALRHALLPWRRRNGDVIILTASPAGFDRHSAYLAALYGPNIRPLPCPRPLIEAALLAHAGAGLVRAAEQRPDAIDSCRSLDRVALTLWAGVIAIAFAALTAFRPDLAFGLALLATALTFVSLTFLKLATAAASLLHPQNEPAPLHRDDLPTLSILVALYGEAEIAPRLIRRLSALDYPRDRLDVIVMLESSDTATRIAIAAIDLPPWMRVIAVPDGHIRTKPRALNFGLDFTRGSIIGIYDAEDAPAPDQLLKVAAAFANGPARLGCVQGVLDFYNPRTNWIARCFTLEYAAWFRLFLPGLVRLGLPVPLGGTTLFLRRDAVMDVGAWDAHNVTEDADLGLRLARRGWKTGMLPSVTMEEANCRPLPWVKQRSRWTKGYLMTWLVHMRAPRRLLRDLGPRRFLAVQVLIVGSLMQGIATPVLWSLWLVAFGLPHPVLSLLDAETLAAMAPVMLSVHALDLGLAALAMRRAGHAVPWLWLPLLKPYALLSSFATAKAFAEAVTCPFHWDKTKHGQHDTDAQSVPQPLIPSTNAEHRQQPTGAPLLLRTALP